MEKMIANNIIWMIEYFFLGIITPGVNNKNKIKDAKNPAIIYYVLILF
jgi:hypothetical protein